MPRCETCAKYVNDSKAYIDMRDLRYYCLDHATEDSRYLVGFKLFDEVAKRDGDEVLEAFKERKAKPISVRVGMGTHLILARIAVSKGIANDIDLIEHIVRDYEFRNGDPEVLYVPYERLPEEKTETQEALIEMKANEPKPKGQLRV